jgi:hypothetical protein
MAGHAVYPADGRAIWSRLCPETLSVLVSPCVDDQALAGLGGPEPVTRTWLSAPPPALGADVVLVASDLSSLRRALPALRGLGSARRVGCVFTKEVSAVPVVGPRPAWPALVATAAGREPHCFAFAEFERDVDVHQVYVEMARSVSGGLLHVGWPSLAAPRDKPHLWPPGDPLAVLDDRIDPDATAPDVLLGSADVQPVDDVLGRAPVTATPRDWLALGPLDETMVNPLGFDRSATGDAAQLTVAAPGVLRLGDVRLDARSGVGDADVRSLRGLPGVRLDWPGASDEGYCRVVAGLAMAGVPLLSAPPPGWARALLHPDLTAALRGDVDLTDRLAREVHSIELRRAALARHGSRPWRSALAAQSGLQRPPTPTVSVVLPTRRPEQLPFALRQVARQRGARCELVLATHGFEAPPQQLDAFRRTTDMPLQVLHVPGDVPFGAVLNHAVERTGGDLVLKMDDDDWYGRDFVADLVLARGYSGADVVGCPPEFTFIEPLWLTTRRSEATEQFGSIVAGGTMLVDRSVLSGIGGFRETTRYVDSFVLEAIRSGGGTVYRTHGHGYVLRRGSSGHTWDPGLGYFVSRSRSRNQWHGFRPSPLLEAAAEDLPRRAEGPRR